jgi:hypothetical protein
MGRRFFVSKMNYMGLAPPQAEVSDVIAVLFGCHTPFVLRRHGDCFKVIGETHVQGIMDGEVMEAVRAGGLEGRCCLLYEPFFIFDGFRIQLPLNPNQRAVED